MQPPGFLYNSRLRIMKLCGGVGFTSQLAGETLSVLSVHLFQPSLLVLSCVGLQRPRHDLLITKDVQVGQNAKQESGQ